ncbi:hypothetical protein [Gracilimonas sediminicola]|uniref:hypothetical protein n=1 Tax=Gracilimonas sediminicola TaxID=2952158 RepID=UPI0038D4A8F1
MGAWWLRIRCIPVNKRVVYGIAIVWYSIEGLNPFAFVPEEMIADGKMVVEG